MRRPGRGDGAWGGLGDLTSSVEAGGDGLRDPLLPAMGRGPRGFPRSLGTTGPKGRGQPPSPSPRRTSAGGF